MFRWLSFKWSVPVNTFYREYLVSPQFSSEDDEAKFRLKICPSGAEKRDYLSIFFISDSVETTFKSKIHMTILNKNPGKHYGLDKSGNLSAANHTFCSGSSPFGWKNFIKITDMMDRGHSFIKNECIDIWCDIGFLPEPQPRLIYKSEEDISMECDDYDCYFEFGNDKHKIDGHVIAEKSEIVKKELLENNNNAFHQMIVKILPSVSWMTFQRIIDFFKGRHDLDGFEREALIVADALQMVDLKEFCESKLAKMVVYENLKNFKDLAIKYNADLILEKCLILHNQREANCNFVI